MLRGQPLQQGAWDVRGLARGWLLQAQGRQQVPAIKVPAIKRRALQFAASLHTASASGREGLCRMAGAISTVPSAHQGMLQQGSCRQGCHPGSVWVGLVGLLQAQALQASGSAKSACAS